MKRDQLVFDRSPRQVAEPRVAVVADFLEEGWPSMDLAAEMLVRHLREEIGATGGVTLIRPKMRRRFATFPAGPRKALFNGDRLLGRFWDYPRLLAKRRPSFDLFHVVDHSYAHVVHALPEDRTVVTCHDLDAFRRVLEPIGGKRSMLRRMARHTLSGMQRAARVICVSESTRRELLEYGLIPPARLRVVPNGVHPSCSPLSEPTADARVAAWLGPADGQKVELLHVGSTIPRKRIDVLLRVFAGILGRYPNARLVRVGGTFDAPQRHLAGELALEEAITVLPRVDRPELAALYRRAALLLLPSEREGFGLPVVEAMACGLPVLASDIPAIREVAAGAAEYAPVGDTAAWTEQALQLLDERRAEPSRWAVRVERGIGRSAGFSWRENARQTMAVYEEILA